jgi:hypothetical protein
MLMFDKSKKIKLKIIKISFFQFYLPDVEDAVVVKLEIVAFEPRNKYVFISNQNGIITRSSKHTYTHIYTVKRKQNWNIYLNKFNSKKRNKNF